MSRRSPRDRRTGIMAGGRKALTLFQQVLALTQGRPFFTADYTAQAAGKVAGWIDWNDPTHTLSQPSNLLQATFNASDPGFNGKPSATFAGARYQSSRPPSAWRFGHDGSSCEMYAVLRGTGPGTVRAICSTLTNYPQPGFHLAHSSVSNWQTTMSGVAGCIVGQPFGAVVPGEATYLRAHYAPLPWEMAKVSNVGSTSSSYASAPSSADPEHTLWLGDIGPASGYPFAGEIVALGFFPSLSPQDRAVVARWLSQEYGFVTIEDVLALTDGRPFFTADYYAVDGVSGKVLGFVDWNDPTHMLMQSNSAAQVAIPAPHSDFAGAPCANFTGAQSYVSNRPVAQWQALHDGVNSEVFFGISPTGGAVVFFLATAANAGVAGFHLYDDGTYRHYLSNDAGGAVVNTAPAGTPSIGVPTYIDVRHRAADTSQYEIRNRGTITSSDPYTATPYAGPSSIPLELGARNGVLFANMRWPFVGCFPALNTTQRATVQRWIQLRYGIAA